MRLLVVFFILVIASSVTALTVNASYPNSVLLVIDDQFSQAISSELVTFEQDIRNDLQADVLRYVINKQTTTPLQIRNQISSLYQTAGLLGVILIGDVPAARVIDGQTPTDVYYEDLDNVHWKDANNDGILDTWWDENGDGVNDWLLNAQSSEKIREVWSGRIQPPSASLTHSDRIAMLKSYFNRNHLYRTGQKTYDQAMVYGESVKHNGIASDGEESYAEINQRANAFFNSSWVFNSNRGDVLRFVWGESPIQMRDAWLSLVGQSSEYAFLNVHGSNTAQSFGFGSELRAGDYKLSPPRAAFIDLASCSNGNFLDPDYLTGWMLFTGETLAIRSNTTETFYVGNPKAGLRERLLANGLSLGEIREISDLYSTSVLIGDPTLKLRGKLPDWGRLGVSFNREVPETVPINQVPVDTEISVGKLRLTNDGSADITVEYEAMTITSVDGLYYADNLHQAQIFLPNTERNRFPLTLAPGDSAEMEVRFYRNDAVTSGRFLSALILYTDSSSTPYKIVPVGLTLVEQGLPGDANGDCLVSGVDYAIWLGHYRQSTGNGFRDGDFNGDGTVTGVDYAIWLAHYRQTCSGPTP